MAEELPSICDAAETPAGAGRRLPVYVIIAGRLDISPRTLEAHRKRIMTKTGSRSLPELLRGLAKAGWYDASPATVP